MKKKRWLIVFFSAWTAVMLFKLLNPGESDGKNFFQHLNEQEIEYIELQPVAGISPIGGTLKIVDKGQIDQILYMWKGVNKFVANHPKTRWSIHVSFHSIEGVYAGILTSTSNQGVMFEFNQGPTRWPVLSDYQLLKSSTEVEVILQRIRFPD